MDNVQTQRLDRYVRQLLQDRDGVDEDWDSPPCTPDCPCPRCRQADLEEAALRAFEQRTEA